MEDATIISTSTITRWIIGASAAIIMTGGSLWLNMVSKQIERMEENFSSFRTKMEQTIDTIKVAEANSSDKAMNKLVDLQIESKMHALRIDQLERIVEANQPQYKNQIPNQTLKKNNYDTPYSNKPPTFKEISNVIH